METKKRRGQPKVAMASTVLLFLVMFSTGRSAGAEGPPSWEVEPSKPVGFFETFSDDAWATRWISSNDAKFNGRAVVKNMEGTSDRGLVIPDPARAYGIAAALSEPWDPTDKTTVLQYEVRLQNGLECGGAYIKFLRTPENGGISSLSSLSDKTPYSIMFGPDKCGGTNKVHFILQHKNPLTGIWEEKHLVGPPTIINDKLPHVYTAVIRADNTVDVLVDGEVKTSGNLLDSFQPPVNPSKEIDDPEDKKPTDWVDEEKIPDETAVKPDDWDEEAPRMIDDANAKKPTGWLDDEPDMIDDPKAEKPADWDDEEDGDWEAPKVKNPLCEKAPGCGTWVRPKKKNPAYKGKWNRPMIPNPAYKGVWAPRKIPNPGYFFDKDPHNFAPIGAIAVEVWTMSDGVLFDNILITDDETVAKDIRQATWKPKHKFAKALADKEKDKKKGEVGPPFSEKVVAALKTISEDSRVEFLSPYLDPLVKYLQKNPKMVYAVIAVPLVPIMIVLMIITFLQNSSERERNMKALAAAKKAQKQTVNNGEVVPVELAKKEDVTGADDEDEEEEENEEGVGEEAEGGGEATAIAKPRQRKPGRRDA